MKLKLWWLVFALATAAHGAVPGADARHAAALQASKQQGEAAHLAAEVLARYHYRGMLLDGALSAKIFDRYVKTLDPERVFFVQADIDRISVERSRFGDAILKEDLSVPFAIFNLYKQRVTERYADARSLLKKGFDFQLEESYQYAREKAPWPATDAEMADLWRKRVKNDWLRLRIAGKDGTGIAEILDKRYDNSLKRIARVKAADAFEAYMNAYTTSIEPHTNYLGPRAAEDFDISMRLSLVGIGAVLAEIEEFATIRELVPGGPASQSGQLKVGDRITGVAQGANGVMTDVQGWRLDDAVALIRGPADSQVVLDVLPADAGPDGKHKRVTLVRKTISLEEQAAKSSVRTVAAGKLTRRIGVITLPSFYEDFAARQRGAKDFKSATRDVAKLLEGLKKQNVDSVLIDLRNNGGGSLSEAVNLTGLFIGRGPVVQQRNSGGAISVASITPADVAWSGPLGVLINRGSASASEIFAAAIQDYGRGLIIGEPSFGKGTVQTVINLDQVAKNDKPRFGELKMTVAQFFRVNGGTTQLRGVKPDIAFPAVFDADSFGESSFDNALPWTQIKAADYAPAGDIKSVLPTLLMLHEARVKQDRDFQDLQQDLAEAKRLRAKNSVSLNEAQRRGEKAAQDARIALRQVRDAGNASANDEDAGTSRMPLDDGLQAGERAMSVELAAEKARKSGKDVFLLEAVRVLGDDVGVPRYGARIAGRAQPGAASIVD